MEDNQVLDPNLAELSPSYKQVQDCCNDVATTLHQFVCANFPSDNVKLHLHVNLPHPQYVCDNELYSRQRISESIGKPLVDNITSSELFDKATKHSEDEATKIYSSDNSPGKQEYIYRLGNIVAVLGEGKVGKTTFVKTFCKDCKDKFQYVFYIDLSLLTNNETINFLRFLLFTYNPGYDWLNEPELRNGVLHYLDKIGNKVCIILDGLDHLITDKMKESCNKKNLYDSTATGSCFLKNILCGWLLPKAKKLIAVRSYNFYQLPKNIRPSFIVWVLGCNFNQDFPVVQNTYPQILQYLDKQPDIKGFCSLPLIWKCLQRCYLQLLQEQNHEEIKCITCIFASLFSTFVKELSFSSCKSTIASISEFVFSHLDGDCHKLVFDEDDLEDLQVDNKDKSAFLTTFLSTGSLPGVRGIDQMQHYFSQILVQEFLEAFALAAMPLQKFQKFVQSQLSPILSEIVGQTSGCALKHTTMVFKFFCGLLSKRSDNCLHWYPTFVDLDKKTDILKELIHEKKISCSHFSDLKDWIIESHNTVDFNITRNGHYTP